MLYNDELDVTTRRYRGCGLVGPFFFAFGDARAQDHMSSADD